LILLLLLLLLLLLKWLWNINECYENFEIDIFMYINKEYVYIIFRVLIICKYINIWYTLFIIKCKMYSIYTIYFILKFLFKLLIIIIFIWNSITFLLLKRYFNKVNLKFLFKIFLTLFYYIKKDISINFIQSFINNWF